MKRLTILLFVASLAATACGGTSKAADTGTTDLKPATEGVPGVVVVPVSGRNHVNGHVDYPTSPPAGGNHNPVWQNCGFYTVSLTNEYAVHSLEHGAVWITYTQSVAQATKDLLAAKAKTDPYLLVSLYPDNPTPIALAPARDWDRSGHRFGDPRKAKEHLGFATETALRDGLVETIAWTRANRETVRRCMLQHARFVPGLRAALT